MCVRECLCVLGACGVHCVHVYGGQRLIPGVFVNHSPLYVLRQNVSLESTPCQLL